MQESSSLKVCPKCNTRFVWKDDKCKQCYVLDIWQTNTRENLGVVLFLKKVIPKAFKGFKYGVPDFFNDILWEALRDEPGWTFAQRQVAIAAPRGSSKTTLLSKGFVLYCIAFRRKRYIVLSSKTARAAQKNLRWLRGVLGSSVFISIFGDLRPDSRGKRLDVDEIEGVWSKDILVLKNGVTVEAVGMGQQLRSAAEGEDVNRIDLFIADDTETDENTKTPDRRESNEEWLFETVLPSLDLETGQIIFINTMTHTESILAKLLKEESGWRKKFYEIEWYDESGKLCSLWKEKFPPSIVSAIRRNYELVGRSRSFYKEYHNRIASDEGFSERWIHWYEGRTFEAHGVNWITFDDERNGGRQTTYPVYITIGIDLAYTQRERSNYSVILTMAEIPDGRKFVVSYKRGKVNLRDEWLPGSVFRWGVIDETKRIVSDCRPDCVVIDSSVTQIGTFNEFRRELLKLNWHCKIVPERSTTEKFQRLKDLLQPEYEAGNMHHKRTMSELRLELVAFGDTTDDILDALYNCVKNSRKPKMLEFHPVLVDSDIPSSASRPKRTWVTN